MAADCRPSQVLTDCRQVLSDLERGDGSSAFRLWPLVYDELRKLGAIRLAPEQPGPMLQLTALVREACLRLFDVAQVQHWDSRGHFLAAPQPDGQVLHSAALRSG